MGFFLSFHYSLSFPLKSWADFRNRMLLNIAVFLVGLMGSAALIYGTWQVSEPSAWIVGGLLAVMWSLLVSLSHWVK